MAMDDDEVAVRRSYAVAVHNYPKRGPRSLELLVGELVEIVRDDGRWCLGRKASQQGLFPLAYVKRCDCTVDRSGSVEVVSVVQPQLVAEITHTLREWGRRWKMLYVTRGERFKAIEQRMRALIELRSSILSGKLPVDQLKRIQRLAIHTMDVGNRELNLDLTVRCSTTGTQVNPTKVSTYRLYDLHVETSETIRRKEKEEGQATPQPQSRTRNTSYSFFASVRNFVCKMTEDAELLMSLYDATLHQHFTENYVVHWSKDGLASDIDQLHNLKVLFTDLGTEDVRREKVFLVCYVVRIGGMEPQSVDNRRSTVTAPSGRALSQSSGLRANGDALGKPSQCIRRPFGVAAMDVTHMLSGQVDVDDDKHHCVAFFPCEKDNNLESLLKKIITNKDLKNEMKTGQALWISVKLLHGDVKQIREEVPHLIVGNISIARKMGFPEVILPSDARNDLYICLLNGTFTKGSTKSSDRNIQVTVRVCDKYGETIPGVIYLGGGVLPVNEYTSVVYYHEDKPKWFEIFKICVPIDEFKSAHILFLFKHRSSNEARDKNEKPFAMSFTPLMQSNGTTLNDTQHCLKVYKVDGKKWPNDIEAAACYLSLPWLKNVNEKENTKMQKGFLSLSPKDSFTMETTVCSTKLTQNVELLGVLNWCQHNSEESLRQSLILLQDVPGSEVVKFLPDILDALFSILTQAGSEKSSDISHIGLSSFDNLVFECLLFVICLVSDRKYHKFQPVLDLYIKESFSATLAYKKLCGVLSNLILEKAEQEKNEILLKSMKCLEYLMRFIVKSRELHAEFTQRNDQHDFQQLFIALLNSIIVMMQCKAKSALTSQGSCIKYLPAAVVHIIQVFPETELSKMIGNMLDVLPLNRLTKQRLMAVLDLVQGPLFKSSECRYILLPHITQSLKIIIENNDETSKYGVEIRTKNRSVDKIARLLGASKHKLQEHRGYNEELELCLKILGEILTRLFDSTENNDKEFNHISYKLLRTIILSASQMDRENPLVCQLVSVLFDILRQMHLERYNTLISRFPNEKEMITFLIEVQLLLKDLVEKPIFLPYWTDMINLENNIMLKIFKLFSHTLVEKLLEIFHRQVWSNWFHLAIAFLTQPNMQLEMLSSDQRRRLISHYGDMRIDVAKLIRHMWFNLGQRKALFVPELVGPFLEMSLIPELELRKATIPLFFDMMDCEFNSPKYGPIVTDNSEPLLKKSNFQLFEDEMIHKLDALVEGGLGDVHWRDLFYSTSKNQWLDEPALKTAGEKFVNIIGCLMDTLLQYRASRHSCMDHRMQATTTLLDFYSKIKRPEMYIRYVNKLCDLHIECENWTEAALTLRLHATLLQWSNAILNVHLKSQRHPDCVTHRDLKEAIYYDIITYLDKGRMWELALMTCKELVKQYEDEVFDYCNLSELHRKMSDFYLSIMKDIRPQPEYFRVGYYGRGFPEFLQNKVFIYRGKDYERLQEFSSRALNDLPNAELMNKLTPPGDDILNSPQQYVQINAVEPIMCDNNKHGGKQICDQILKYYKTNEITKFRYSRPFHRQDILMLNADDSNQNEFASLWLERTELEISEKLPGIIRWYPVIKSKTYELSPLEVAIETMSETNKVLKSLIIEHRSDATLHLDPLTRKLNGLIDPAVMGGIEKYEEAFFNSTYSVAHPEHKILINNLKEHIAFQIPLLENGIEVHKSKLPDSLIPLHQRMVQCFEKMKAHVHENYGKKTFDLEKETSTVTMRRQMSVGFRSSSGDNRWSEISTQTNCSEPSFSTTSRPHATSSFKTFTSQINKQINRGSFSAGSVSVNLGLNTPVKKKDKEKRKARKQSEILSSTTDSPTISGSSQWYTGSIQMLNSSLNSKTNSSNGDISPAIRELTQEGMSVLSLCDEHLHPSEMPILSNSTKRHTNFELVASRPLRSEVEKEKRLSQRPHSFQSDTNSSRNSAGSQIENTSQFSTDVIEAFNVHFANTSDLKLEDNPPPLPQKTRTDQMSLPPLPSTNNQESYYLTLNFPANETNKTSRLTKSAINTPLAQRQDYDQVVKPRGSFLYSSLQGKNVDRKKMDRAPTPPPKKRMNSIQQ